MPRITPVSWKQLEKFVISAGCKFDRQNGDHLIYCRGDLKRPVVFPKDKEIPVFIIRNILRVLNISAEKYAEMIKKI